MIVGIEVEIRQAALCVIRRNNTFLVAEIKDPHTGAVFHRPPGGGLEDNESPERAVRRELLEELGVSLSTVELLGKIDHIWFWKGRDVRERAWVFLADSSDDARLGRGENPDLLEASGQIARTFWRSIDDIAESLPPLCPRSLAGLLGAEIVRVKSGAEAEDMVSSAKPHYRNLARFFLCGTLRSLRETPYRHNVRIRHE
jgi:8-oxo-dGTP pyrophosphatase MutT (NUDIX family)